MWTRNKKLITLLMVLILVLSQSIVVLADYVGQPLAYDMTNFPGDTTYANEYYLCTYTSGGDTSGNRYYSEYFSYVTYSSDTEVVLYLGNEIVNEKSGHSYYMFGRLSNSSVNRTVKSLNYSKGEFSSTGTKSSSYLDIEHNWCYATGGSEPNDANGWLLYNSMKIFDTKENAQNYLDTGSLTGLVKGESTEYNADEIYLDNFYFEVHDSNSLEEFYITFYYTPSDYLIQNGGSVNLDYNLQIEFDWFSGGIECTSIGMGGTLELPCGIGENVYRWDVSADDFWEIDYGEGFIKSFGDALTNVFLEEAILGDEAYIDLDGLSIGDFGGNSVLQIQSSVCNVSVFPLLGNQRGKTYTGEINFLAPELSYYNSNTPNTSGNYTSDGNYTQQDGYYYTEVSQDNYGNNVYNYYYITDNSRTEIDNGSSGGGSGNGIQHHYHEHKHDVNVNVNGSFGGGSSGSSNDVTIEDDDLTPEGLRSAIEDGYGIFDLISTEKDNDGFLSLLTNFVDAMDDDMNNLIGFGMGTTVVLAIILRLLNR